MHTELAQRGGSESSVHDSVESMVHTVVSVLIYRNTAASKSSQCASHTSMAAKAISVWRCCCDVRERCRSDGQLLTKS
jgi:hypothetical protein